MGSPLPHGAGGPRAAGPAPLGRGPRPHTAPAEAEAASRLHGFSNTHPASCLSSSITLRSHRSSLHAGRGHRQLGARTVAPVAWRPTSARRGPSWHQSPVRSTRPPAPTPGATLPEPQAETGSTAGHGGLDTRGVACESGRGDPTAKGPAFPGAAVQEPGRRAWSPCSEVSRCPRAARGRKTNQEEPDREGDRRERPRREIPTGEAGWEVGRGVGARGSRAGQGASLVEPRRGRRGERCRGKTGSNLVFPQREIIPNASKRPSAQGVGKGFLCHNPGHPKREGGCVPRRTHTQTCTSKENPCCDKNDKPGDAFATRFYHRRVADVPNI